MCWEGKNESLGANIERDNKRLTKLIKIWTHMEYEQNGVWLVRVTCNNPKSWIRQHTIQKLTLKPFFFNSFLRFNASIQYYIILSHTYTLQS